jgi:hypothetical protein
MIGRFNPTLFFTPGTNKLNVAGTLDCDAPDAGKRVRIHATLNQNGDDVACHEDFMLPNPPAPLAWTMEVSSDFTTGTADGDATATVRDGNSFAWEAPDANENPPVPPIDIVRN